MTSTLTKQSDSFSTYKKFKVISFDGNDTTYFLEYSEQTGSKKSYCWCRANQILHIRTQVEGYLSPHGNDGLPTLIVSLVQ